METLAIRKIHVDSRYRTNLADSHSDFRLKLSQPVNFPDDVEMIADNISIPNTVQTVNASAHYLYMAEYDSNLQVVCRAVPITHGYYTGPSLAQEIGTQLNVLGTLPTGWTSGTYLVQYDPDSGNIRIHANFAKLFHVMSDAELQAHDGSGGLTVNKNRPASINNILRYYSTTDVVSNPVSYDLYNTFNSLYLDLLPVHAFMICSNLNDGRVMSPQGLGDTIACVPCNVNAGITVHHNATTSADAVLVSRRSFETLTFQLRNSQGELVDLNGASWSMSLVFVKKF